jgi:uncharacterized protein YebE (UPF0316 family)
MVVTPELLLAAGGIFLLRVLNYAISTIRMVAIARDRRRLASGLAFVEAFLFAVVIASVVKDISENVVNLLAYCLGAAAGGYVGMAIESRYITSYMSVNIVAHERPLGHNIALALRDRGFGVTETMGEGLSGAVTMVRTVVSKRDVQQVVHVSREIDPQAFIAVEEARTIHRGWLRDANLVRRQGG